MSKNENDRLITVERETLQWQEQGRQKAVDLVSVTLHNSPNRGTSLRLSLTEARDLHQRLGAYLVQEGSK